MADRVALYLQDAHSLQDAIEYVQYAESRGFEAVWQAESRLVRDAIVPMAAFAATTKRIKIGSGVINNWTRNAGVIAAILITLIDLTHVALLTLDGTQFSPIAIALAVASLFALVRFQINATWLIAAGGLVGLLVGWLGVA